MKLKEKLAREIRHQRVRRRVVGTPLQPRLSVFRSSRHIYAQIIDDSNGHTLVQASSLDKELKERAKDKNKTEVASLVGELLAQRALEVGLKKVVFDRGGCMFHGRIKALADTARSNGLEF